MADLYAKKHGCLKSRSKIVGLTQVNNEWPLLVLSISHALMHHVDDVYVLNHVSANGTFEDTRDVQELWQGRVHVLNSRYEHFWQEAAMSLLIDVCQEASPDWIYVFDADEFLITPEKKPLRGILDEIDPKYSAIRYEVQNWVSPRDFDETRFDHYRRLRYRSIPDTGIDMFPETMADSIEQGALNFYDIPFLSKIIFRNNARACLAAGAHANKIAKVEDTFNVAVDTLRAAHLPFLSKQRLHLKARQGQLLIRDKFPAYHGWQSQLVYKLQGTGKLDEFWESHSIGDCDASNLRKMPSFENDQSFSLAIEPTLSLLEKKSGLKRFRNKVENPSVSGEEEDTKIPFRTAIYSIRKSQLLADSILRGRNALSVEYDALAEERKALSMKYDALAEERNALSMKYDTLAAGHSRLVAERDAIMNSRTWRYTRFLRRIRQFLHYRT